MVEAIDMMDLDEHVVGVEDDGNVMGSSYI